MPAPVYMNSINRFSGDGVTTDWNINFAGGYLRRAHVKGIVTNLEGTVVLRTLTIADPADFIGPNQIRVSPAAIVGEVVVLFRDTPKDLPLVNFTDGSLVSERNLDLIAQQAVFIAAEMVDKFGDTDGKVDVILSDAELASVAAAAAAEAAGLVAANFDILEADVTAALAAQDVLIAAQGVTIGDAITAQDDAIAAAVLAQDGVIATQTGTIATLVADTDAAVAGQDAAIAAIAATVEGALHYDISVYSGVTPAFGQVLMSIPLPYACSVPAGMVGSMLSALNLPASSATLTVRKNGADFGTITISPAGVVTKAAAATSFVAGDLIDIVSSYSGSGFSGVGCVVSTIVS